MASAAKSLGQLAFSASRRIPTRRTTTCYLSRRTTAAPIHQTYPIRNALFSTSSRCREAGKGDDELKDAAPARETQAPTESVVPEAEAAVPEATAAEAATPEGAAQSTAPLEIAADADNFKSEDQAIKDQVDGLVEQYKDELEKMIDTYKTRPQVRESDFQEPPPDTRMGFWGEEEDDEFGMVADEEDETQNDDMTSVAHQSLEQHREYREYARIAAWDMPSLHAFAQPFTPPAVNEPVRYRYTTYMGEQHPAQSKVVLEVSPTDLTLPQPSSQPAILTSAQRLTLLKLAGPRYDPHKDIIKMSCEKYPSPAQNKRYLSDLLDSLIDSAKNGDSFADIPLDLRHAKTPRAKHVFPADWLMNEQKVKQLAADREQTLLPGASIPAIIDGSKVYKAAVAASPELRGDLIAAVVHEKIRGGAKGRGARR